MYIVRTLTISALTHMVNLKNMEMSAQLILPGVIGTYDPGFRYDNCLDDLVQVDIGGKR